MQLLILYQPKSEHARLVEEFMHDFTRAHPDMIIELVDVDSVEGSSKAQLYDIVQYPSLLAVTGSGELFKAWSGTPLPLMAEVASYLYS